MVFALPHNICWRLKQVQSCKCRFFYYGPFPKALLPLGLTHCILADSSTVIWWTNSFVILGVSGLFCRFYSFMTENPGVASDLGLHCLPIALLRVLR